MNYRRWFFVLLIQLAIIWVLTFVCLCHGAERNRLTEERPSYCALLLQDMDSIAWLEERLKSSDVDPYLRFHIRIELKGIMMNLAETGEPGGKR